MPQAVGTKTPKDVKAVQREHHACLKAAGNMLSHARRAGQALLRLKAAKPHGKWHGFVAKAFGGSPSLRECQNYMRISAQWKRLCEHSKTKRVSFLSLREALRILSSDDLEEDEVERRSGLQPVLFSAKSAEWYTDDSIIDSTKEVLGTIDLDHCSDPGKNVPAKTHFTAEDDGLRQKWQGKVYLNPPYGRELVDWIKKLRKEYPHSVKEAVLLLPSRTDTEFFSLLSEFASCFCFIRGRLTFSGHENAAPFPSLVAYVGKNTKSFVKEFSKQGNLFVPYRGN